MLLDEAVTAPLAKTAATGCAVAVLAEGETMQFRLAYEGPLPAEGRRGMQGIKHEIRRAIHPQLRDLCRRDQSLGTMVDKIRGLIPRPELSPPFRDNPDLQKFLESTNPDLAAIGRKHQHGEFEFVPIIVGAMHAICELDILFLRREKPGSLIKRAKDEYGGDLDNRVKVFLDALRVPSNLQEIPKGALPDTEETPFFCLLEDDAFITRIQVEADTLLGEPNSASLTDVRLIVRVTTKVTQSMIYNLPFSLT